jgi:uncharacterized protein (TIGR03083 family)
MEFDRYLETLAADADRLSTVAAGRLAAPVPSCPEWAVRDVVEHVTFVYLHKVECMRRQARPDSWPPELPARDPLELFGEAYEAMRAEFVARGPSAPSYTWFPPDQTVGFWFRRMAQETAVHRVDVELAAGEVTPVDAELAADGVEELLRLFVASDEPEEPVVGLLVGLLVDRVVELATGERTWRVAFGEGSIQVLPDDAKQEPSARISGPSSDLLLWTWGRGPIDPLTVDGDDDLVAAFRDQLRAATQ